MPTTLNRRSTDESLNLFRETVRRVVDEQLVARREGIEREASYIATSGRGPGTLGCCARRRRGADGGGSAGRKLWHTELQGRMTDAALQLFGGAGYMNEYLIAQHYRDARVRRNYADTSEIMREVIGRSL